MSIIKNHGNKLTIFYKYKIKLWYISLALNSVFGPQPIQSQETNHDVVTLTLYSQGKAQLFIIRLFKNYWIRWNLLLSSLILMRFLSRWSLWDFALSHHINRSTSCWFFFLFYCIKQQMINNSHFYCMCIYKRNDG